MRFEVTHVYLNVWPKSDGVIVCDQRYADCLAQMVQGCPQDLLGGSSIAIRPEEGEQLLARQRLVVRGKVEKQGTAFLPRDSQRLIVEQDLRRTEQLDGQHNLNGVKSGLVGYGPKLSTIARANSAGLCSGIS